MKNVIVTGATRGLGLAICERLLADSAQYRIIGIGRTPSDGFQALLQANPERLVFHLYDLEDLQGIPALVQAITRAHGPLYGLVNNAALGLDGLLATQHATEIARALRVNLESPILLTKYACRSMLTRGEGRIVNISSIIASTGFSGLSVYGATKAGIEGFTRSLSRELGRARITVNCVAPGYMETDMTAGLQGEKLNSIRRRAPLGLPRPQDVAGAIAYLLSPEASMTTGSVITVDGGKHSLMGLIRTRLASDADRPALIEFIRDHWSARHVFVADPAVFDWQYRQADGRINMMLAERLEDDASANILGVLGFIPMGRFDPALGDRDIMLALWKVRDDIAPPGLGLRLLKAIQAQLQPRIIGAIGISEMVGPIYRALGYQLDHLCQAAVMNPMAQDRLRLAQGVPADAFATAAPPAQFALRDLDPARDAGLVAALAARGSLQKSWDYLRERYLDHPWYDYDLRLVMQGDRPEAVVIWRAVEAQGARILRIVDVIGGTDWLGEAAALLRPELVAAGAEYIDIMACGLDEDMLRAGGLVSPDWCPGLILPNYFAPYEPRNIRIALAWKNFGPETADKAPMRLFRADSDQDRPNQPMPRRTAAPIPQES